MERRKFIKTCGYTTIGIPLLTGVLQSCTSFYYATSSRKENKLIVAESEFLKDENSTERPFVLIKTKEDEFPICLYKIENGHYVASLLKCTHQGCELNIGGGIYSCPCHGSEFSTMGKVLEGPAETDLKTYKIETDDENIYIFLS